MQPGQPPPLEHLDSVALLSTLRPALVAFFMRRCGSSAEAEDLAQDVLVRALKHAQWDSIEEAKGYIFRIAANRWLDRGRRHRVRRSEVPWVDEEVEVIPQGLPPDRVVGAEEELRLVLAAIDGMGARTREIFVLCRLEKMKQIEVAELLGISVSTVERHLVQAIGQLMTMARQKGMQLHV